MNLQNITLKTFKIGLVLHLSCCGVQVDYYYICINNDIEAYNKYYTETYVLIESSLKIDVLHMIFPVVFTKKMLRLILQCTAI